MSATLQSGRGTEVPRIGGESVEQKWPSHLVIVRHGESERNEAKDAAKRGIEVHSFGSGLRDLDTKLTPKGHLQALAVG